MMVRGVELFSFMNGRDLEARTKRHWEVDLRLERITGTFFHKVVFL